MHSASNHYHVIRIGEREATAVHADTGFIFGIIRSNPWQFYVKSTVHYLLALFSSHELRD